MKQPTAAIIGGAFDRDVALMFSRRGYKTTDNLGAANVIVFTGGADISPTLYGEPVMASTGCMPQRDKVEVDFYKKYPGKPFIGICRGAQLLNVLNGGKLYQHVNNHGRSHPMYDLVTKQVLLGTSMHHQMMIAGPNAVTVAVAGQATEKQTPKGVVKVEIEPATPTHWTDAEVLFYPNTKVLCYQGHPEVAAEHERSYFFGLVERYLKLYGIPKLKSAEASADVFAAAKDNLVGIQRDIVDAMEAANEGTD